MQKKSWILLIVFCGLLPFTAWTAEHCDQEPIPEDCLITVGPDRVERPQFSVKVSLPELESAVRYHTLLESLLVTRNITLAGRECVLSTAILGTSLPDGNFGSLTLQVDVPLGDPAQCLKDTVVNFFVRSLKTLPGVVEFIRVP